MEKEKTKEDLADEFNNFAVSAGFFLREGGQVIIPSTISNGDIKTLKYKWEHRNDKAKKKKSPKTHIAKHSPVASTE